MYDYTLFPQRPTVFSVQLLRFASVQWNYEKAFKWKKYCSIKFFSETIRFRMKNMGTVFSNRCFAKNSICRSGNEVLWIALRTFNLKLWQMNHCNKKDTEIESWQNLKFLNFLWSIFLVVMGLVSNFLGHLGSSLTRELQPWYEHLSSFCNHTHQ